MNDIEFSNSILVWWSFIGFVGLLLFLDLFILGGKKTKELSIKRSIVLTSFWISLAILFNIVLWFYLSYSVNPLFANQKALEFFTGYLLEQSLSVDNIFVFIMIFNYFAVPPEYQRKVLFYGIIGAVVLRLIMILSGIWLIHKFSWIIYIFGLILIYSSYKLLFLSSHEQSLGNNKVLISLKKILPLTKDYVRNKFIVREHGVLRFTPLFLVLIFIELTDVIFAVDSIPAIFGVTQDSFIVFSSNIFAILGLRSLYFLFIHLAKELFYLKYAIAIILGFVGIKMLISHMLKINIMCSLLFIFVTLLVATILSLLKKKEAEYS